MFHFHFFGIFFSFSIRLPRRLLICKIFRWPPYWNCEKVPYKNRITFGLIESKIISASEIKLGISLSRCPNVIFKVNGSLAVAYRIETPCMISWHWFPTRHAPTFDTVIRLHITSNNVWAISALKSPAIYSVSFRGKDFTNSFFFGPHEAIMQIQNTCVNSTSRLRGCQHGI